jgi:hypothetical protein
MLQSQQLCVTTGQTIPMEICTIQQDFPPAPSAPICGQELQLAKNNAVVAGDELKFIKQLLFC